MPVEAPVAPAAPAAPAAPSAPAAPAAPTPEVHISAPAIDKGPQAPPPKRGSARERLFQDLRKKAGAEEVASTSAEAPPQKPQGEAREGTETPEAPAAGTPEAPKPGEAPKGKVSPWKLVDEHKAARVKLESEIAELRKSMVAPEKVKVIEEKMAAVEKRNQELEDHIRFVDYTKSKDFQEKYQKPYTDAWTRWMNDLSELTVVDPATRTERPIAAQDLLELVNLPLQRAREQAESVFGNFADDVMSARKEIRGLFDAQSRALEEAKKSTSERMAQLEKEMTEKQKSLRDEVTNIWKTANESVQTDERIAPLFKPVEGDEEGNKRLAKGYEMADRAFAVSPFDPNLTPEQRSEIVRLHAAVRNRAAAFGRIAYQKSQLEAQVKALTEELNSYKEATPGTSRQAPAGESTAPHSAREEVFGALRKLAH